MTDWSAGGKTEVKNDGLTVVTKWMASASCTHLDHGKTYTLAKQSPNLAHVEQVAHHHAAAFPGHTSVVHYREQRAYTALNLKEM